MIDLSLVIPVYNGEPFLSETLARLADWVTNHGDAIDVIIVNDGSADRTADILKTWEGRLPHYRHIDLPQNMGKGAALKAGFAVSSGQQVAFTDADLPYGLAIIDHMTEVLSAERAALVYGSRSHNDSTEQKKYGILRRIGRRFFSRVIQWLPLSHIPETPCGL